jgi:hypothetical protein
MSGTREEFRDGAITIAPLELAATPFGLIFGAAAVKAGLTPVEAILSPVAIRMPNGAVILPHSAVLPGSRVGEGETWGGVPARPIPREEMDRIKASIRAAM